MRFLVKNMTSEGKYYLVVVWIKPKLDEEGNIVGYKPDVKYPTETLWIEHLHSTRA